MAVLGDDYNLKLLIKYHDKENLRIKYNNENICTENLTIFLNQLWNN